MLRERVTTPTRYTVFGETVIELMRKRGITRQEDLAALLTERTGVVYQQQTLSKYFVGTRTVAKRLPKHLVTALELNSREKRLLADAFAYGQESYSRKD